MTYDNLQAVEIILAHDYKIRWLRANRGVLAEVAKQLSRKQQVSKQFVRLVFWGQRRSQRVERALRRLRAPGFELKRRAA